MSRVQEIVISAVRFWFPDQEILINHRPPWLHGMELDIFIPGLSLAIEVQGRQHYNWAPELQTKDEFQAQRNRDNRKMSLCASKRVHLLKVKEGDKRLIGGVAQRIQNVLKRKVRHLPPLIKKAWNDHRFTCLKIAETAPRIKVGRDKITPINQAAVEFLKAP